MSANCPPKPNAAVISRAGGCVPGTTVIWVRKPEDPSPKPMYLQVACVNGRAVKTLTEDSAGLVPSTYTEADKIAAVQYPTRGGNCEDPVHVEVCEAADTTPALNSALCDGSTVDVKTVGMAKRVVNEPGTALLVKMICEKPERDRPFKLRCTPAGGTVLMRDVSEDTAPIGTPPQLEYWNLDQTLYTGDVSQLTDCGAEKVDVTAAQWFCASGTPISRTDFWDVFSTPRALLGSMWQDAAGNIVPAPAAGTFVVGDCSCVNLTAAQRGIQSTW